MSARKSRYFILVDKDVWMKEFPFYREQDMSIDELRELIAEYSNLHLIFLGHFNCDRIKRRMTWKMEICFIILKFKVFNFFVDENNKCYY